MKKVMDWTKYAQKIREAVSEGIVLLKNDNNTLPIKKNERISVFGRIQLDYYSTGAGSGGMVNTPYEVSIIDALLNSDCVSVNKELLELYKEFEKENPFDPGVGWAQEPYFQEEMDLNDEIVKNASEKSDIAIIVIGRCAGEDKDAIYDKGSYLLTDKEDKMLSLVCSHFDRTVVLLNVGSIMDMSWVKKYNPQSVMYVWQGGVEGGNGICDVLTGSVSPSGHLADTIAMTYEDYPSSPYYGGEQENIYKEDIYVGYRYFESAAKDKVLYPFGFGLSYTDFDYAISAFEFNGNEISLTVKVTNVGKTEGKEVIQIYYEPAQGMLKKPVMNLIRFEKTETLMPGEMQELSFRYEISEMASYDDAGISGNQACYILEKGEYNVFAGRSVRDVIAAGSITIDNTTVTRKCTSALMPVKPYKRMVVSDGVISEEDTPLRCFDLNKRIEDNKPINKPYEGDKGYKFEDVAAGRISTDEFLSQLTDLDLIHMTRGEGMCSSRVTPGIAGAIGGVTDRLVEKYGIPTAGCSDGPAGIRMDCGSMAFSLPSGTLLACSFNKELVSELFEFEGMELAMNGIDALLGPGLNIHRNPLNGRNFEYFSEDPYLTGAMAVAELKAMHKCGVTGTLKHFAGNNQEFRRHTSNAIISERALREIYLKGFEMAVKEAGAYSIMSTYGPLNGTWTAGSYDLLTTILRNEWGFAGIVMTDWWARVGLDQEFGERETTAPMVIAQNDVYMVVSNPEANTNNDNEEEWLAEGKITRGELLRNATNIFNFLLKSAPAMERISCRENIEWEEISRPEEKRGKLVQLGKVNIPCNGKHFLQVDGIDTSAGTINQYSMRMDNQGFYRLTFKMKSDLGEVAQMNVSVSVNKTIKGAFTLNGTNGQWVERYVDIEILVSVENFVDIMFGQSGIEIGSISVERQGDVKHP